MAQHDATGAPPARPHDPRHDPDHPPSRQLGDRSAAGSNYGDWRGTPGHGGPQRTTDSSEPFAAPPGQTQFHGSDSGDTLADGAGAAGSNVTLPPRPLADVPQPTRAGAATPPGGGTRGSK